MIVENRIVTQIKKLLQFWLSDFVLSFSLFSLVMSKLHKRKQPDSIVRNELENILYTSINL